MDKNYPTRQDLATLWLITYYNNKPAVVLFHPLEDPTNIVKKWDLLASLQLDGTIAFGSEFTVKSCESLQQAIELCNSIPQDLIFTMVWDGKEFTHHN
jgi:hypothetical protein